MHHRDQAVVEKIRAHHAMMEAHLREHVDAVARADAPASLAQALDALLRYWRYEVMPHAAAEESTIYAAAGRLPAARTLIQALRLEHQDLTARAGALADVRSEAVGDSDPATTGTPLYVRAAMEAAAAAAVFHVHAKKENDFVLPALVEAEDELTTVMERMERAFGVARRAAERAPARR